jgi:predicted AlkP superfamily pyrophosphatase or phosphodiesterase
MIDTRTRTPKSAILALAVAPFATGCWTGDEATSSDMVGSAVPTAVQAHDKPDHKKHHRADRKVILFVWDGLRPDSVDAKNTPNLAKMRDVLGVNFTDNHAVFPTFTMMNASAFATGSYPGTHGFYGNTEYQPGPAGKNAGGSNVDFSQPVFTEDYGILQALDGYYQSMDGSGLFLVDTLFETAHKAGLTTAAVGKSGPAFMQDFREDGSTGVILDENIAFPLSFAQSLQAHGLALPSNSAHYPYPDGTLTLAADNGNPTATTSANIVALTDGVTSDPRSALGSPHNARNEYMMKVYLDYVLPTVDPDLTLIWFRNPDSTEHTFGPGTSDYIDALHDQDMLLGKLLDKVNQLGLAHSTDVVVASDHGHTTVAGDAEVFPLRALTGAPDGTGAVGAVDSHGYSVSGDIRTADWLSRAGFTHVYDGNGCVYDPVLSGIKADGTQVYPTQVDSDGSACGSVGKKYSTGRFLVPATLPTDAVVVAANGGSDYLYVPSHSKAMVVDLVTFLQQRQGYGAIFVSSRYDQIDGTLPLSMIDVEGAGRASPPTPDIVVSFDWDDKAVTAASTSVPGTEYESAQNNRGMHGTFGPVDVHNTLIAAGPDFKRGYRDRYPSGNVDVAPTAAAVLGLSMPQANGRVLEEALDHHEVSYQVKERTIETTRASLDRLCSPDDPDCAAPSGKAIYAFTLRTKVLSAGPHRRSYTYFDQAKATRQPTGQGHHHGHEHGGW